MKVYEALLAGSLREFSIGFGIVAKHWGDLDGKPVRFLDELELLEISVVWKGAARTRTIEVRSDPAYATSTASNTSSVNWATTPVPEPQSELAEINAKLDSLVSDEEPRDPDAARAVDELIQSVREELIHEALGRAEAAAWEERMRINLVLDPVAVRVDTRMRPVAS